MQAYLAYRECDTLTIANRGDAAFSYMVSAQVPDSTGSCTETIPMDYSEILEAFARRSTENLRNLRIAINDPGLDLTGVSLDVVNAPPSGNFITIETILLGGSEVGEVTNLLTLFPFPLLRAVGIDTSCYVYEGDPVDALVHALHARRNARSSKLGGVTLFGWKFASDETSSSKLEEVADEVFDERVVRQPIVELSPSDDTMTI